MKKLLTATAIFILVTALILIVLFGYSMSLVKRDFNEASKGDPENPEGTGIVLALMLVFAIPLACSWLLIALVFIVLGIVLLTRRGDLQKAKKTLLGTIIFAAIMSILFIASAIFFCILYREIIKALLFFTILAIIAYVANIVLISVAYSRVKKQLQAEKYQSENSQQV